MLRQCAFITHGYRTVCLFQWDLVCGSDELAELSQTLVMIGQAVGAFIFAPMADRIGRKSVHVGCHICLFGITLATSFAPSYIWFALMRTLTGFFQQVSNWFISARHYIMNPLSILDVELHV